MFGFPGAAQHIHRPRESLYPQTILSTPDLFGYWRLNEAAGANAIDSFGTHNLSINGTVTIGQEGPILHGGAFLFGGGYLQSGYTFSSLTEITIECWLWTSIADGQRHAIYSDRSNTGIIFMLGPNVVSNGALYNLTIEQDYPSGAYGRGSSGQDLNDSAWHHVAGVINGTNGSHNVSDFLLYRDGAEVSTYGDETYNGTNWPLTQDTNFRIGAQTGGGYPFSGYLAELALYTRALSSDEIAGHFAAR